MTRLDQYLLEQGLAETRSKARALILAGKVRVNGMRSDKAGALVPAGATVTLDEKNPFVSRGGLKLQAAIEHFGKEKLGFLNPNLVALDIGASTGGFTDCLLQNGFQRVIAVDVGYGQLDYRLRHDPRVNVLERVNIRNLDPSSLEEKADLIVIDVSFISILKFLDRLAGFLKPEGKILALVKPQFEASRKEVGKGGVIRDQDVIDRIVDQFISQAKSLGFETLGTFASPVHGAKGNREVFCFMKNEKAAGI